MWPSLSAPGLLLATAPPAGLLPPIRPPLGGLSSHNERLLAQGGYTTFKIPLAGACPHVPTAWLAYACLGIPLRHCAYL